MPVADEAAGEGEEGLVDVCAAFVADPEASVLVEPGEGAFDHPALLAETGPVLGVAFGDDWSDAAGAKRPSVWLGVVAAVGEEGVWSAAGSPAFAADGRDRLDEREELGDVRTVGGGEQAGEGGAVGVGDQVVFASGAGAVDGAGAGLCAPKSARSEAESHTARERSSWSACRSLARRSWCRRSKTPDCCHWWRRRQQVMPEP